MASREQIGQDVCELVGNTPMVYLNKIADGCAAKIAVKVEWMNPAGSVKDRIGIAMRQYGHCSSFCGARGYHFIATMPSTMSGERRTLLGAFGADLVLTDPALGTKGCIDRAEQLANAIPNSFIPMQASINNSMAHSNLRSDGIGWAPA
uniref:Tryptophan synthase beta chain-like PALP domain-containing protein n=1 Tax=Globodera rostochiensis TaxID=31243 RepID=A0A914I3S4_GLORO